MRLSHPNLPPEQTIEVTQAAYEHHYSKAGWQPVDKPSETGQPASSEGEPS